MAASSDATRGEGEDGGKERDGEGGRGGERGYVREKKRRKLRGEDDTEMEMRYAANDNQKSREGNELKVLKSKEGDVDILDKKGHINLFTEEEKAVLKAAGKRSGKNAEVEKEKKGRRGKWKISIPCASPTPQGSRRKLGRSLGISMAVVVGLETGVERRRPWWWAKMSGVMKIRGGGKEKEGEWRKMIHWRLLKRALRAFGKLRRKGIGGRGRGRRKLELRKMTRKGDGNDEGRGGELEKKRSSRRLDLMATRGTSLVVNHIIEGIGVAAMKDITIAIATSTSVGMRLSEHSYSWHSLVHPMGAKYESQTQHPFANLAPSAHFVIKVSSMCNEANFATKSNGLRQRTYFGLAAGAYSDSYDASIGSTVPISWPQQASLNDSNIIATGLER